MPGPFLPQMHASVHALNITGFAAIQYLVNRKTHRSSTSDDFSHKRSLHHILSLKYNYNQQITILTRKILLYQRDVTENVVVHIMSFSTLGSVARRAIISRHFSLNSPIMSSSKMALANKYNGLEKNVWVDLIDLAMKHKPLNLGQGFPDFAPPKHVTDALAEVAMGDNILLQQYTRGYVILYC